MTSPPLISWLGAIFTAIKGGRFVFWVMDLNPDEALAAGWLHPDSRTTRVLNRALEFSFRHASAIVALDRFMSSRIEQKGVAPQKISIVPPWSHDASVRYDEEGRNRFRSQHGLSDKFVVMYSGNHSPCHPLTTLLEAARQLRDRADVAFCFIGGGSEFATVARFAEEHRLNNVVRMPYQPLAAVSASLSSADLHVVVMGDPFVGIVHPCKVYNIRTLGIPFLYIGPAKSHVAELGPACSARHGDVTAVVHHIRNAVNGTAEAPRVPSDAGAYAQEHLVQAMASILESAGATSTVLQPGIAGA
jgi:glycosyltransferase involved in cell wall biosynthesis